MTNQDASPLMRQYRDIKRGYPQAILFFRVGDFYEMFFDDAEVASRALGLGPMPLFELASLLGRNVSRTARGHTAAPARRRALRADRHG